MSQPSLSPVPERGVYVLDRDYSVWWRRHKVVVPAFFRTDGASIPRLAWSAIYSPWHPRVVGAAVAHDWVYWNHQMARDEADRMLKDLLLRNGAGMIKAEAMYRAVRICGGGYWPNDDEDLKSMSDLYRLRKDSHRIEEYHFPADVLRVA